MEVTIKKDREILNKYLNGSAIKSTFQTPLKNVRAYVTDDDRALFISTKKQRSRVAILLTSIALRRRWNSSIHIEGSYLIGLLYP